MVTIALDAMGGDNAPEPEVAGAVAAVRSLPVKVMLVGRKELLEPELAKYPDRSSLALEVVHASERITMEDSVNTALRNKRDSSLRVASRLVRDGVAQGLVSAGNTGAVMATAKMVQGVVHGVERPALASACPTLRGQPAVMIDVGANVDSTPRMLAQFAVMGEIYARTIMHRSDPRVGLLSIGEEEHKGNDLTKAATPLLKSLPLNFIGNVEGRHIYSGDVDVIVCDGFTGNVALKVSEGVAEIIKHFLHDALSKNLLRRLVFLISRRAFADFQKRIDYSEYGGAPLLGVKGVCIICHGRSNGNAIKNAIRVAAEFYNGGVNQRIEDELREWAAEKVASRAN